MKRIMILGAIAGLLVVGSASSRADDGPADDGPAGNAALFYWRACAQFSHFELSKDDRNILFHPLTAELNDDAAKLIRKGNTFMYETHRGAKHRACDWGTDPLGGPMTLLPHMDRFRPSAALLLLRARQRFSQIDPEGAIDDLAAALMVARHLGCDETFIGLIVQNSLEDKVVQVFSKHSDRVGWKPLWRLNAQIDQLPRTKTVSERFLFERDLCLDWLRATIQKKGVKKASQELRVLAYSNHSRSAKRDEIDRQFIEVSKGNEASLMQLLDETSKLFEEASRLATDRKYKDKEALKRFRRKLESANVVTLTMWPAVWQRLTKFCATEEEGKVRIAMLKAAVTMKLRGKGELKKTKDPYGEGPFEFRQLGKNEFQLQSKLIIDEKPVVRKFRGYIRPK